MNYCDFSDYQRIVSQKSTWVAFETIFLRKSEFERHITSARRFRNALKHLRDIEPVERLAGHAAILWLEKAIGQTRFSDRVVSEQQATVEDCLRVLTRRAVPEGQRQLLHALVEAGPPGLTGEELVVAMARRDMPDLSGVLGALGNRINRTPGYGESQTPGIDMLLDVTQVEEGSQYSLKPIMLEALRQFSPSWLSRRDIDEAIAARGKLDEGPSDPEAFREACTRRAENALNCKLKRQSSVRFSSDEGNIGVVCLVSREYRSPSRVGYWFGLYPSQRDWLEEVENGCLVFGCGSPDSVLLIPIGDFAPLLSEMNQTAHNNKKSRWHVHLHRKQGQMTFHWHQGSTNVDLSQYLI